MCRDISWVVKMGVCHDMCVLLTKLLVFALLHFVLQGQICLLSQVSFGFLLLQCNLLWWKGHLFVCVCVLVLKGVVSLHRDNQFQLIWHQWLKHRLGLLWYWMVLFGNELRSFCSEIAPSYCILTVWLTMKATPFFAEGFLPTVVDIMVIWIKFSPSCPFLFTSS